MIDKLTLATAAYEDAVQKARQAFQDAIGNPHDLFRQAVLDTYKDFPDLEEAVWLGFTPYFNDGEPCTFGHFTSTTPYGHYPLLIAIERLPNSAVGFLVGDGFRYTANREDDGTWTFNFDDDFTDHD